MAWQRALGPLVVGALLLGACGDDDSSSDDDAGDTVTSVDDNRSTTAAVDTSDTTTTTATGSNRAAGIAVSPLTVPLDQGYGDGEPAVAAGDVTVSWYQADGMYVALYSGEGSGDLPALCPGNSLALPSGEYDFISNAPTAAGGCDGVDTTEVTEVVVCDTAWIFPTLIPADSEGQLFASISSSGTTAGVLGFVATVPDVPEIDVTATSFEVAPGVLPGDAAALSC